MENSHDHAESSHGHVHDGNCCEHGHADDGHHEHGHDEKHGHGHGHSHDEKLEHEHAAEVVALGLLVVGDATFVVDRDGAIVPGKPTTFQVELLGNACATPHEAWLEGADGQRVCEPAWGAGSGPRAVSHMDHWQFTLTPTRAASKFVLRAGEGTDSVDLATGGSPRHGGLVAVLRARGEPGWRGWLELKLHDDDGELELWLHGAAQQDGATPPPPMDVPSSTVVSVAFPSHPGKAALLRARNSEGAAGGRTNHFVFPAGGSGADEEDASWLRGAAWRGVATVSFEADGKAHGCEPFVLVPHGALL